MNHTVSANWLNKRLKDKNIKILDASIKKENIVIPGSKNMDLFQCFSSQTSKLPNTLPSAQQFEKECQKLGVDSDSIVIIYDTKGVYSSPRAWWLFKIMGHKNVAVLDGGLPEWRRLNLPLENNNNDLQQKGSFKSQFKPQYLISYQEIVDNCKIPVFTIADARAAGRFMGTEKEPRPHINSGKIPHSINIPFEEVLENGKFKSQKELRNIFNKKNSKNNKLVFSCGSGLTACIILLANNIIGENNLFLFDGSWTEWAESQKLFVQE